MAADWAAIEREFRLGQRSNREIATAYGVSEGAIRKRARTHGWQKDLSSQVRQAVRGGLVRAGSQGTRGEREAVASAAEQGVAVVLSHRGFLGRARALLNAQLSALEDLARPAAEAEVRQGALALGDQRQAELALRAASLPGQVALLKECMGTLRTVVGLERQAFNLEDGPLDGEEAGKELGDDERHARLAALLDAARTRRAGQAAEGDGAVGAAAGAADDGVSQQG